MKPDAATMTAFLDRLVSDKQSTFSVSGAVFAVANRQGEHTIVAKGEDAHGKALDVESLFPLASASKLATGLLILRLVDEAKIDLQAEIGNYLPEARSARTPGITVQRLLSHTSGMPLEIRHDLSEPPGSVRYRSGLRWPGEMAAACLDAEPAGEPGAAVQYSNVAYGLLGLVAERVAGRPFARLLDELVFEPLGVEAYVDRLSERPPVAVSDVPSPYAGTELEPYNSPSSLLLGVPWACVVTNAAGALQLLRSYGADGRLLSAETAAKARSVQTGDAAGGFATTEAFLGHGPSRSATWAPCRWGLAIEVQGGKEPHWAPPTLPDSFGQIGSSGCLAWHDPGSGVSWVLFGARTTNSGWLLRHGARIARAALDAVAAAEGASG